MVTFISKFHMTLHAYPTFLFYAKETIDDKIIISLKKEFLGKWNEFFLIH